MSKKSLIGLLIVLLLGLSLVIYIMKISTETKYKLTIYAKDQIDKVPVKSIPIEVVRIIDSTEKIVASKKTDKDGIVIFNLPPGKYGCKVREGFKKDSSGYFGAKEVDLKENMEVNLEILKMLPPIGE